MAVHQAAAKAREEAKYSNGRTTVERVYKCKADTSIEALQSALSQSAPTGLQKLDASATPISDDTRLWWQINVTYGYPDARDGGQPRVENPLDRPAIVSYSFESWTEDYFVDTTDKNVVNAAGETYESQPQRQRSTLSITVQKNIAANAFDPLVLCDIADTTNLNDVVIKGITYPAGTLRMLAPTASEQYETGSDGTQYHYYTVSYQLMANVDGWTHEILEAGYHELVEDSEGARWIPILDELGNEVSKPYPLNSDGSKGDPANPVYTTYYPYWEDAWAGVSFG